MKVLITGGAGFIGSYTSDLLIEKGYSVRILDSMDPQTHRRQPENMDSRVDMVKGDVTNPDACKSALDGIEAVIHLAGRTGISHSMYNPVSYVHSNSIGVATLYESIMRNEKIRKGIRKIIVASSKTIYGEGSYACGSHGVVYPGLRSQEQLESRQWEVRCPECGEDVKPVGIKETKPPQNLSIYALSKYDTEITSLLFGSALQIPTIAFRYFSAFGPKQSLDNPYSGVCAIFVSRLKNGKQPVIFEDGNQLRDFVYVEDVARSNLFGLEKMEVSGSFNIGSGCGTSVNEIASNIINIFGSNINPIVSQEFRIGDTRSDFADITEATKRLGFTPKWSVRQGLEELVEWSSGRQAEDMFDKAETERKKAFGGGR